MTFKFTNEKPIQVDTVEVNEDIFNTILKYFKVEEDDDIFKHITNKINKNKVYYSKDIKGNQFVLIRKSFLSAAFKVAGYDPSILYEGYEEGTGWKTVRVRLTGQTVDCVEVSMTGKQAYNILHKILLNYYTQEEYEAALQTHIAEYDKNKAQFHYLYQESLANITAEKPTIRVFDNCFKYDINSAYASELIKIFPNAKDAIIKLYNERKVKPQNKKILNYFVGYLCCVGHRLTFNYIVQNISNLLSQTILKVGGRLLYANTDGFLVQNPNNLIDASKNIGEFKLEYEGQVQFIQTRNYYAYQFGDEITGTLPLKCRTEFDLRQNKYAKYNKRFVQVSTNKNGRPVGYFEIENLRYEVLENE